MKQKTDTVPPNTLQSNPSGSHPGRDFGALLYSRRYTGTAYFIAAAAVFVPLQIVALLAFVTGPGQSVGFIVSTLAFTVGMGLAASALFVVKGRRRHGLMVEIYEHGMRFKRPPAGEAVFFFAEVKELKKRTIRRALANLTFVLVDGRTFTVDASSHKDGAMLQDVLTRFGPMQWQADRGFRIF